MYSAYLDRTRQSIEALKKHVKTSDMARSVIYEKTISCKASSPCFNFPLSVETAPDRLEWRIIDHCAVVTRIYAIYEQFAHEMIKEHVVLLQKNIVFSKLPEEIKSQYRRGLATIFEKKDGPRYGHLDLQNLVEQYSSALSDKDYTLEPLALIVQEQNLRLPELSRLMATCGISNVGVWISKHRSIQNFFSSGQRLGASAEHEMKELVKYRNDAAHGSISFDELPGLDYLYEFCDFISAVCEAISERVQLAGLECLIESGSAESLGEVEECLKSDMVLIGKMVGEFTIGGTIYLCGEEFCLTREIVSLQLDNITLSGVTLLIPTEIGFSINKPGRKNSRIVCIPPLPPQPQPQPDDILVANLQVTEGCCETATTREVASAV